MELSRNSLVIHPPSASNYSLTTLKRHNMKKISRLMFLSLFACACKNTTHIISNRSVDLIAIVDVTNQQKVLPQAESILKLYDFDSDRNIKASFRICIITD